MGVIVIDIPVFFSFDLWRKAHDGEVDDRGWFYRIGYRSCDSRHERFGTSEERQNTSGRHKVSDARHHAAELCRLEQAAQGRRP